MNYIRDIDYKNKDDSYNMIIEIEKGTNEKTELVPKSFDRLEKVRNIIGKYPYYYGCMPQTFAGDKDPLDVILFSDKEHCQLDIVKIQIIGVIKTIDNDEVDDKILAIVKNEHKKVNMSSKIRKAFRFLKEYKGKKANMVLDKEVYLEEDALELVKEAHKQYLLTNRF